MDYKSIKHIYINVLCCKNGIKYHGNDEYTLIDYHKNGKRSWEARFDNGIKDGIEIVINPEEKILWRGIFYNGLHVNVK